MEDSRPRSTFGELVRAFRLVAGLSQEALAERAHISTKTVGALEQGFRRAPYRHTVALLANALNLSDAERVDLEHAAERARVRDSRRQRPAAAALPMTLLPKHLTPFIERPEIEEIAAMLEHNRLLTLTGSGGIGKTRAAVEVALRYAEHTDQPVAFADLTSVTVEGALVDVIASAVSVALSDGERSPRALAQAIGTRGMLLIVDNCEHVVEQAAETIAALLRGCENLVVLATSRELLGLSSEVVYRLPSLQVPEKRVLTMSEARSYSAVALFLQRAHSADSQFVFELDDVPDIIDICSKLNGIPLAIELAAARVPSVGLRTLSLRIGQTLSLEGERDLPARQRTMEATISWSFALLSDEERRLLLRLGVFSDAFTLDAAEHTCSDDTLPVDRIAVLLPRLVDKSLVNVIMLVDKSNVNVIKMEARYALLETIRAFSRARLKERGELEPAYRRHAQWLAAIGDVLHGKRFGVGFHRPHELENARTAADWCMASGSSDDLRLAARIVGGMRRVWYTSGYLHELRSRADALLEKIDDRPDNYPLLERLWRARFIVTRSFGREFVEEKAAMMLRFGDWSSSAMLYARLASQYATMGDFERADEAVQIAQRQFESKASEDDPHAYLEFALILTSMLVAQGNVEQARRELQTFKTGMKDAGIDPDRCGDVANLSSRVEFVAGNVAGAVEYGYKAVDIMQNYRAKALPTISACADLSCYLLAQGDVVNAERVGRIALDGVLLHELDFEHPDRVVQYVAAAAAIQGRLVTAGRVLGFLESYRGERGIKTLAWMDEPSFFLLRDQLEEQMPPADLNRLRAQGARWDLALAAKQLLSDANEATADWSIERIITELRRGQVIRT